MTTDEDIRAAYESAKGRWAGCTWPTERGCLGLDLNGVSAAQARAKAACWRCAVEGAAGRLAPDDEALLARMAELLGGKEAVVYLAEDDATHTEVRAEPERRLAAEMVAEEWEAAARWLQQVEADAAWAEEEARLAVAAAGQGDWGPALRHACEACAIESEYDAPSHWGPLRQAIAEAIRQSPWGARCGLQRSGETAVLP
jgi:hypothetical protein